MDRKQCVSAEKKKSKDSLGEPRANRDKHAPLLSSKHLVQVRRLNTVSL